ncbi:MAG: ribosome-associated translation inhibitor RaiA [Legionella sp.]|nr:ribosome-associated translation inhibitor RaiA [Legionella sp.]
MGLPLRIKYLNVPPSEAVDSKIHHFADKLEKRYDRILGCHVVIQSPHRRHHKGNLYQVNINLSVPEAKLVASRESSGDHSHEDLYVSVRDAFQAIQRQLQDYVAQRRGHVKHHESLSKAKEQAADSFEEEMAQDED